MPGIYSAITELPGGQIVTRPFIVFSDRPNPPVQLPWSRSEFAASRERLRRRKLVELYDTIGGGYSAKRQPDPRIALRIRARLSNSASVVNVGAGAGSYEPDDISVIAVEPSHQMIRQRRSSARVVQAKAEALPFEDSCFDAAMAVLTVHHWTNKRQGFEECARAARRRIVVFTWDPESDGFWLVRDYFPELLAIDRAIFPTMDEFRAVWSRVTIDRVAVPADCIDGFLGAFWRRPQAYLDPAVRAAMSTFARVPQVEARVDELRNDLASGAWERRNRRLLQADTLDIGYRLITADLS